MSSITSLAAIDAALEQRRFETTRRLCLAALPTASGEAYDIRCRLHAAYRQLGDFAAATQVLEAIVPQSQEQEAEKLLRLGEDYLRLSRQDFYRTSAEAKAGLSPDEYEAKMRGLSRQHFESATAVATTPALKARLAAALRRCGFHSEAAHLAAETSPAPVAPAASSATGTIAGTLKTDAGLPLAGVTVSLGLRLRAPSNPNPADYAAPEMHYTPDLGETALRTTVTDAAGQFRFDAVPAGEHDFLAVTTGPQTPGLMTQFLAQPVTALEQQITRYDLMQRPWTSAPAALATYAFPPDLSRDGKRYRRVLQQRFTNPFVYRYPRQLVTLPQPNPGDADRIVLLSTSPDRPHPHQLIGEQIAMMLELPETSELVVAVYEAPGQTTTPTSRLRLIPGEQNTAVIDTGVTQIRIPSGQGAGPVAPILAARGADRVWRGHGRLQLPAGVAVQAWQTQTLLSGPLVLRVEVRYQLSTGQRLAYHLEAHEGEPYLLVHEVSAPIDGASFDFSLREFSGGRGFIHWTPEAGGVHWTSLTPVDRTAGRLLESVPWWWHPDGFGYAMTADGLQQQDYIGVFTVRRGEWIDRKFESICRGPGDEPAWRRELDWPYPEMVGSTLSMITAHTDASGDAFIRFPLFDGERHWGLLVSTLEQNDGTFKQISAVQHKNSSPRLQDLKDWHLDEPDQIQRPHLIVRREQLPHLRSKKTQPKLSRVLQRLTSGESRGSADALIFAVDGDPLVAWRTKRQLAGVAHFRARMTLLGRDFSDMYSPVGARPITDWAADFDLIVGSGVFTPDEERLVRAWLLLMGHLYMSCDLMNWKLGSRNANFEADRVDVVGTVGLTFQGNPAAARMTEHAIACSQQSLKVYCTPGSGKWYENPACYYLHASKCRMNLIVHLVHQGLIKVEQIERLREFLSWGLTLLTPPIPSDYETLVRGCSAEQYAAAPKSRRVPPIGDHAHVGRIVPDHYALASLLFRQSDPAFADQLMWAWLNGGEGGEPFGNAPLLFSMVEETDLQPKSAPPLKSRRLEGFGAVFRDHFDQPNESYLLFKQGPGGYRYHRTEGSILFFADGKPLIYDGGEAGETWRHTTLSFFDTHLPMAAGHVERFFTSDLVDFCQGVHPTVIRPGEPVFLSDSCHHELVDVALKRYHEPNPAVTRTVVFVKDQYVILHDVLNLDPTIPHYWHLQAVADSHTGDWRSGYRFKGRFGVDLQVLLPGQQFAGEKIEQVATLEYKLKPQDSFAMRHLQLRGQASHYTSVLRPLTAKASPLSASLLKEATRVVGVSVQGDGVDDVIWFSPSPRGYRALLRRAEGTREVAFGDLP